MADLSPVLAFDCEKFEREMALKEHEVTAHEVETRRARWASPLVLAIVAATVAGVANAVVASLNADYQRQAEAERTESARILQVIQTGDAKAATANLQFLMDAGLISEHVSPKLAAYLKTNREIPAISASPVVKVPVLTPLPTSLTTPCDTPDLPAKVETDVALLEVALRLEAWGECNASKLSAIGSLQPKERVLP
ncbi:hypothetical protein ACFPL7_10360 [Dongia soli]|uniref:Uncharacterized protein n=1 Tax=Dongia soli TaxID=600628 RepID=A0ABU5ED38_9PROT|nr:hypothetical protein [Dongia soli]MDY0883353.1 hypothetical protein [Dongia soli]